MWWKTRRQLKAENADLERRLQSLCRGVALVFALAEPTEEQVHRYVQSHRRNQAQGKLPHNFDYSVIIEPDLTMRQVPRKFI